MDGIVGHFVKMRLYMKSIPKLVLAAVLSSFFMFFLPAMQPPAHDVAVAASGATLGAGAHGNASVPATADNGVQVDNQAPLTLGAPQAALQLKQQALKKDVKKDSKRGKKRKAQEEDEEYFPNPKNSARKKLFPAITPVHAGGTRIIGYAKKSNPPLDMNSFEDADDYEDEADNLRRAELAGGGGAVVTGPATKDYVAKEKDDDYEDLTLKARPCKKQKRSTGAVSEENKKFACNRCPKRYACHESLIEHRARKHSENPPVYKCKQCNKGFTDIRNCNRHEKTQHMNIWPYMCECGFGSTSNENMESHKKRNGH